MRPNQTIPADLAVAAHLSVVPVTILHLHADIVKAQEIVPIQAVAPRRSTAQRTCRNCFYQTPLVMYHVIVSRGLLSKSWRWRQPSRCLFCWRRGVVQVMAGAIVHKGDEVATGV
jgi:hypothetical protein